MPHHETHCTISKERFGEDGAEFHTWLDQYAKYGYRHRQVLHNREGVVAVQLFGEMARCHIEQHIRDDYDGTDAIPTIAQLRGWPRPMDGLKEKKETPKGNMCHGFGHEE